MLIRLVGAGLVLVVGSAAGSVPGDYHEGTTLNCSECHVMHPGAPPPTELSPSAPDASAWVGPLLREDVNSLCLSCHDDSRAAADVLGRNSGSDPDDLRQAGFLNRLGHVGSPATGHTLDSLESAPGSVPRWSAETENGPGGGLSCINCHGSHGSQGPDSAYRNLRSDAGNNLPGQGLVTYNDGTPGANDLSRDVFLRRPLEYGEADVDFNEPDPSDSGIGRFCAGCHQRFHGAPGSGSIGGEPHGDSFARFLRHPTAGTNIGRGAGSRASIERFRSRSNRLKVMSEVGIWDPPGQDVTPTCITCHKAHGNDNAFGLIFRSGSGRSTENGDTGGGALEHLCRQCHTEGPLP